MWNKPDLIGVGRSKVRNIKSIQNFSIKVINIGTPRFENYFKDKFDFTIIF